MGAGTSFDDSALEFDNLCAFKSSGTVGLGYDEESTTLSGAFTTDGNSTMTNDTSNSTTVSYMSVDPGLVYVTLTNEGEKRRCVPLGPHMCKFLKVSMELLLSLHVF